MVNLAYVSELQYDNTKFIICKATFVGNYGTNGVGDLMNLAPYEQSTNPNGITDASAVYNLILGTLPSEFMIMNEDLGGSYVGIHKTATSVFPNLGLIMWEPGGTEKATAAAYTASELAGSVMLAFGVPYGQ
jgi:hypothetical protein